MQDQHDRSTETAADKATRKIRESISRRAAARAAADDTAGLESLWRATLAGRDSIADHYKKLTGRAIAEPTETPSEAIYRADADAGEQAEQIAELVETLAWRNRELESARSDKSEAQADKAEIARKYAAAIAENETLRRDLAAARAIITAAGEAPETSHATGASPAPRNPAGPNNLGATVTPQVETGAAGASPIGASPTPAEADQIFAELHAEDPDPKDQRRAPNPAERDAEKARAAYVSQETRDLFAYVMTYGGIRPSTDDLAAEYAENVPPSYRRRDGMRGDELADQIRRDRPEYRIENENDLLEYFGARRRAARDARATARA